MSYNLSIKNINFLQKFCILTNAFLITPWYDFQKQTSIWPVSSKLLICGVFLLKFILIALSIITAKSSIIFEEGFGTQKFFFVTFLMLIIAQNIFQIVTSTFFYQNRWKQILINFEYVDVELENENRIESNIFKNFYFRLLAKNLFFFALFIPYFYSWYQIWRCSIVIFMTMLEIYNQFIVLVFLHCLVKSFGVRYNEINKRLVFVCCNSIDLASDLKQLRKLLIILAENIDLFNDSFGYYFLFIIVYCGVNIVHCANFIFLSVSFRNSHFEYNSIFVNAIMITFLTVSIKNKSTTIQHITFLV